MGELSKYTFREVQFVHRRAIKVLELVVYNLFKIGLWRRDDTTSTHHRFSNESSDLINQRYHIIRETLSFERIDSIQALLIRTLLFLVLL